MALGNRVPTDVDERGRVTARMVPREDVLAGMDDGLDVDVGRIELPARRAHYRLAESFTANNPNRLEADRALNFEPGFTFEKYELLVRDPVTVFISFGRPASGVAHYDDVLLNTMQTRSDRCEPATLISLWFQTSPGSAADLYLYAGRAADPI